MYDWRKLTKIQRNQLLVYRKTQRQPWHSPPHWDFAGEVTFLITAACYEHAHIIGNSSERMTAFESELVSKCQPLATQLYAWCVLPNHYHILLATKGITPLLAELGKMHGRLSFLWNGEDNTRGRKVWYNCHERAMRSDRHFWACLNYVHHNPVHHQYVERWQDWPFSSAAEYLEAIGRERALEIWKEYPVLDFGKKWDVP
ncbi:MAG: hypothetical protein K1Y36_21850 [Blastocatellia bacterium]|nr:hypothetical protein [Blastocatellia bacterium]